MILTVAVLLAADWASLAIAQEQFPYAYEWSVFTCRSEFPLPDAETLGGDLATVRADLTSATALEFPAESVQLTLFATRDQYIADVSQIAENARRQRGVFLIRDDVPNVYSFEQPDLITTLRHESAHALLHSALPYVPLWLDEGLASYFESELGLRHHHLDRVQFSLRLGWNPNLKTLESRKKAAEMDLGDYRHAWAWVAFLLNESEESRGLLQEYLQNIAIGEPPQPLSAFLADRMPDARARCETFLRGL